MKTKQAAIALFVVLASVSMFTACGKKKNSSTTDALGNSLSNSASSCGGVVGRYLRTDEFGDTMELSINSCSTATPQISPPTWTNCVPLPASGGTLQFNAGSSGMYLGATGITAVGNMGEIGNGFVARVTLTAARVTNLNQAFGPGSQVCGVWFNNSLLSPNAQINSAGTQGIYIMSPYLGQTYTWL